jgi:phosphatidylglycerophosphate synthase
LGEDLNRRPVGTRKVNAFHALASFLVKIGFHPNHISIFSSVFAAFGAVSLWMASRSNTPTSYIWLVMSLVGVQGRLVCNLIDGLMAVEGGMKTPTGELFNDLPDRFSDAFLILAAGFAAAPFVPHALELSIVAAFFAIMTAYIRVLGASIGAPHFFTGPMAKQHRMFVLNLGILGSAFELSHGEFGGFLWAALWMIAIGSFVTCIRRLQKISKAKKA